MTAVLVDTFTASNGTLIQDHTPDTGDGPYEAMGFGIASATGTENATIESNEYRSSGLNTDGGRSYRNPTDPGDDEYDVEAVFNVAVGSRRRVALHWRMTPTGTSNSAVDRYTLLLNRDDDFYSIRRTVSGTTTSLATVADPDTAASNIAIRVESRADGQTVYRNGVELLSTDDTTISQRGRVGCGGTRAGRLDDLTVTPVGEAPTFDPPNLDVVIDGTTAHLSHDPSPIFT